MAENLFDDLQDASFDVVTNTYGYDATWSPSEGGDDVVARVLFNNPTNKQKLSGVEYDPYHYKMEYKKGDLPGLKEAIDKTGTETVTIQGQQYYVRQVLTLFDGRTMEATLEPVTQY